MACALHLVRDIMEGHCDISESALLTTVAYHLEAVREIEVQLHCAALPPSAYCIPHIDVNFGPCTAAR